MRDFIEQLAEWIFQTDLALAVAGGHDCPYYLRSQPQQADKFESFDGQAAVAETISLVQYRDLPLVKREEYFRLASRIIQGDEESQRSDWYDRMGVKRPGTTLTHLRTPNELTTEAVKAFDAFWADGVKRGKVLMHSNERLGYKALWLAAWAARETNDEMHSM